MIKRTKIIKDQKEISYYLPFKGMKATHSMFHKAKKRYESRMSSEYREIKKLLLGF